MSLHCLKFFTIFLRDSVFFCNMPSEELILIKNNASVFHNIASINEVVFHSVLKQQRVIFCCVCNDASIIDFKDILLVFHQFNINVSCCWSLSQSEMPFTSLSIFRSAKYKFVAERLIKNPFIQKRSNKVKFMWDPRWCKE